MKHAKEMTKFSTQIMLDEEIAKIKTISGNFSEEWSGTKTTLAYFI